MNYLLLLLAGLASAGATLLLRRAGTELAGSSILGFPTSWILIVAALASYGTGFLAYAKALQGLPANVAYPIMTGLTLLATLGFGALWLGEFLTLRTSAGVALLLMGIILIGTR